MGGAVEAVVAALRRNKLTPAPYAVWRCCGHRRGASGEGFPRISWRSWVEGAGVRPVMAGEVGAWLDRGE